jgi:hypothetical protein
VRLSAKLQPKKHLRFVGAEHYFQPILKGSHVHSESSTEHVISCGDEAEMKENGKPAKDRA